MMSSRSLTRRTVVKNGSLILFGSSAAAFGDSSDTGAKPGRLVRVGLITDLHYADKEPRGTRYYRESLAKLDEAARQFSESKPDFVVELGDLIDAADSVEIELGYLATIQKKFAALPGDKHCVLGNHCVDTLTKGEFLGAVGQEKSYYSFDVAGVHFVVLDSCFRSDGTPYQRKNFEWTDPNSPREELDWLKADLAATTAEQVIVFAHQRLDVEDNHGVNNAADVRQVFEASGKVRAVFQGHSHKNDHKLIGGTHYVTLVAMVEGSGEASNGYSTLDLFDDGTLTVSGFRKQNNYQW